MSFFISPSVSITAGSRIVRVSGSPDISDIRKSDMIFIGSTGPYEVDFASITAGGERLINLVLPIDVAFTNVRCVIIPTAGDFVEATKRLREVSQFGVNVFSSLSRWATDEVATIDVVDAAGVVHTVPTIWSLTNASDNLTQQTAALKTSIEFMQPLVARLQSDYAAIQPTVDAAITEGRALKQYMETNTPVVQQLVADATSAKNSAVSASTNVDTKHTQISGWVTQVNGQADTVASQHSQVLSAATNASNSATAAQTARTGAETARTGAETARTGAETARTDAQTARTGANSARDAAIAARDATIGYRDTAANSANAAAASALLAQRWASAPDNEIIADGNRSARYYMVEASKFAQQTAANVSGGMSFRGFHDLSTGFPSGANTGYMYKLSGGGSATFEGQGTVTATVGDYIIKTATGWVLQDDATDSVKTNRTINGFSLAANVTLTAFDVGARAATWVPGWGDVTGKPTTLAGFGITDAVSSSDSRLTNSREWTASTISQAEAEAGTSTTRRAFTAERVAQAIAARAVPLTRTVNGQALNANITLTAADVSARVATWVPSWADVTGKPTTLSGYAITDAVSNTSIQVTDWDTAVHNAFYISLAGATNVPKAASGWQGFVSRLNAENIRQFVWNADGPAVEMYSRCGDGTPRVWSPWVRIRTDSDGVDAAMTTAINRARVFGLLGMLN